MYTKGIASALVAKEGISLNNLRDLCQMTLMEAHVRNTDHDFYAGLLDDTEELYGMLMLLEVGVARRLVLKEMAPERTPEVLDAALSDFVIKISKLRARMAEKVSEMALCPDKGTALS